VLPQQQWQPSTILTAWYKGSHLFYIDIGLEVLILQNRTTAKMFSR